jgi:hypothetical protein
MSETGDDEDSDSKTGSIEDGSRDRETGDDEKGATA